MRVDAAQDLRGDLEGIGALHRSITHPFTPNSTASG
jgi:hypothetical protein